MDVFDLMATLRLDSSEYENGLQSAKDSSTNFGSVVKTVGGVAAGVAATVAAVGAAAVGMGKAIYSNVSAIASSGDEIDKASQSLGISAELYQKLGYAAELSGTSIDAFSLGVKNITGQLSGMMESGEYSSKVFDALGVSVLDADNNIKDSQTVMMESLMALADMTDETQRNALANELFGRSYQDLLPMLNSGADGIAAMMQEAEDYGMVISDEVVKSSAGFNDALTQLTGTFDGVKTKLLADFLPSITTVMDGLSDLLAGNEGAEDTLTNGFMSAIDNFEALLPKILDIVSTIIPAVLKVAPDIIGALIKGIVKAIPKLVPSAINMVDSLLSTILSMLPDILDAGIQIIVSLVDGVAEMLPTLIPEVVQTIIDLITTLLSDVDMVLDAALGLISGLADGIISALPILINALPQIILGIINFILSAIPKIIETGVTLLMSLVSALPQIIIGIVKAIPQIIAGIIEAVLGAIPELIVAGIELFLALIEALPEIIIELVAAIPEIITSIVQAFKDAWPQIKEAGMQIFQKVADGLAGSESLRKMGEKVKELGTKIKDGFKDFINTATTWGRDLMSNFISGITAKITALKNTVTSVANTVKSYLGFSEPESGPLSNFHTYAPDMMKLFTEGIYDNEDMLTDAVSDVFDIQDKIGNAEVSTGATNSGLMSLLAEYLPQIANMQIVMDTGATVGQLAPSMDAALGRRLIASGRSV